MYHQKLLDSIKARTGREEESDRTRITLSPYTSIYSAEVVPAAAAEESAAENIRLTLHNIHTRAVAAKTYDAVFCGTGYDRDWWMGLLAASNLAECYGVKSSTIELVPESEPAAQGTVPLLSALEQTIAARGSEPPSDASSDGFSTPPTPDTPHSHHAKLGGASKVRVSRTYRLLPLAEREGEKEPRVYLQGCTQATHGLSESLLSILGVRAGLVVDDIWGA